ncbi:hypothetical protein, partial [Mixta calida]|uniref:hypothetical protein n=1 Tax=Mixta calida TaxID=665913 RepID=UPI002FDB5765
GYEPSGRRFESSRMHHLLYPPVFYLPDYFSSFSGLVFSVIPFIAPFISLSLSPVLIARQHSLRAANSLTFF